MAICVSCTEALCLFVGVCSTPSSTRQAIGIVSLCLSLRRRNPLVLRLLCISITYTTVRYVLFASIAVTLFIMSMDKINKFIIIIAHGVLKMTCITLSRNYVDDSSTFLENRFGNTIEVLGTARDSKIQHRA